MNKALIQFKEDCLLSPHLFATARVLLRNGAVQIDHEGWTHSVRWYKLWDKSFMRIDENKATHYSPHGLLLREWYSI